MTSLVQTRSNIGLILLLGACQQHTQGAAHPRPTVTTVVSPTRASVLRFPSDGCQINTPLVPNFAADTSALDAVERASELSTEPTTTLVDGAVRAEIPTSYFASRVDGEGWTAFRIRTGNDEDVITMYVGDRPEFHPQPGHEIRVTNGAALSRGSIFREQQRWRMEVLTLLPCAAPRHVHLSVHTDNALVLARASRILRSVRVVNERTPRAGVIALEFARDHEGVEALFRENPVALSLAQQALHAESPKLRYPLNVVHALADQELTSRWRRTLDGVSTEVWLSLVTARPVTVGMAFRAVSDTDMTAMIAQLRRSGCVPQRFLVASDGIAIRCPNEPELRVGVDDADGDQATPRAVDRLLRLRSTWQAWSGNGAFAWGFPRSLCGDPLSIQASKERSVLSVRAGRCMLALDDEARATAANHGSIHALALAVEGECRDVANEPWSQALRTTGRFETLATGDHGASCRYTLGVTARGGWVVSANNDDSASGPIRTSVAMGVDPHAVSRAVGVLVDLASLAAGRSVRPPAHVHESVLTMLPFRRPGTISARNMIRHWFSWGGLDGPLPVSVLGARTVSEGNVSVVFPAWTLSVHRDDQGEWSVNAIQETVLER